MTKRKRLTKAQKQAYLDQSDCCPYCGSVQLHGHGYSNDEGVVTQLIECLDWERAWDDVYVLTNVEERP